MEWIYKAFKTGVVSINKKLLLLLLTPVYVLTLLAAVLLLADAIAMIINVQFISLYLCLCTSAVLLSLNWRKFWNLLGFAGFVLPGSYTVVWQNAHVRIHFWQFNYLIGGVMILMGISGLLFQIATAKYNGN